MLVTVERPSVWRIPGCIGSFAMTARHTTIAALFIVGVALFIVGVALLAAAPAGAGWTNGGPTWRSVGIELPR